MIDPARLKIPERGKPAIDLIFAALLLVATLSTAVCVYQAARWNGVQAINFGESAKYRTESIRRTGIRRLSSPRRRCQPRSSYRP